MYIGKIGEIASAPVEVVGAKNAVKKHLIGPAEGWKGWVMRMFILDAGGHSPLHTHPWPHINYVVSGRGTLSVDGKAMPVAEGSVAYVPAGKEHQYVSAPDESLVFICIVPEEGDR